MIVKTALNLPKSAGIEKIFYSKLLYDKKNRTFALPNFEVPNY